MAMFANYEEPGHAQEIHGENRLPMKTIFRAFLIGMLAVASRFAQAQAADLGTAEKNDALSLIGRIPVPNMTGTWDHLTVDLATDRLFASAQEDNQVRVFDLIARKPRGRKRIGLVSLRPHGRNECLQARHRFHTFT